MTGEQLNQLLPAFALVAARVGGMALTAPVFGSAAITRVMRVMIALVLALGISPAIVKPIELSTPQLAVAFGGELLLGVAIGLAMRLIFVAVQWAGELIGQQMGLSLGGVYDPNFGEGGTTMGGIFTMLTLVVFLIAGGHRAMLAGVRTSFDSVPLMTAGFNKNVLDMLLAVFQASMSMTIRLAAPILVTVLIVELVIGFVARTIPSLNNFGIGMSLRPVVGLIVLMIGIAMSADVIAAGIKQSMWIAEHSWAAAGGQ
jgi:flagellar biosynthetic protein FliR